MSSGGQALPAADALYDHAASGLMLTSADGTIRRANATLCGWLGYEAAELVDTLRFQALLTMGGRIFHQTHWAPLLRMQHSLSEVKLDLRHRDGHTVPMLINARRSRHGEAHFDELAFFVVQDRHQYERELLLARRAAEAALEQRVEAERALQESRDVLGLVMRSSQMGIWTRDLVAETVWWSRELEELVGLKEGAFAGTRAGFHDFVHRQDLPTLEAHGKLALRRRRVDLAAAMEAALEAAAGSAQAAGHKLVVSLPEPGVFLDADMTRIVQAILNLLNNAVKYTPTAGRICFGGRSEGGEAVISVRDSGIGIAAENLPRVFGMFEQVAPALENAGGGLGIGLALVRALVELHGGTVTAFSAGIGQGSEFVIRLPLASPEATAPPAPTSARDPAAGLPPRPPARPRRRRQRRCGAESGRPTGDHGPRCRRRARRRRGPGGGMHVRTDDDPARHRSCAGQWLRSRASDPE